MVGLNYQNKLVVYERTLQRLRWLSIATVFVTFPLHLPQTLWVHILLLVAAVYSLARMVPAVQRSPLVQVPGAVLFIDNLLVGLLLWFVGDISTPYSALLVFGIIAAAYLYQIKGVLAFAAMQTVILCVVVAHPYGAPITLSMPSVIAITLFALVGFGYLVVRLTGTDRQERDSLVEMRRQSEHERLRLLALLNSLDVAIFLTDSQGKIIDANEAARVLADKGDIAGKQLAKALPLHARTDPTAKPVELLSDQATAQHRRDLSTLASDDKIVDLDISVTPVRNRSGDKIVEYIVVCEDITTERSLDEQRTEFISVASHELRTPLAILEAALENALVPSANLSQESRPLIEQAHRNARYLAGIIRDITFLAEAKNDNLPMQLTEVHPGEVLENVCKDFAAQTEEKGLGLKTDIAPHTPAVLSTERYIREILQNYLTNAIKYSNEGTITLSAAPTKNSGVLFSVSDEGIGISPQDQKLLFTKFFRSKDFQTRSASGTGLGLYLCMEIAQRLGAKLWCESKPGKGSTFYLEVPPFTNLKGEQDKTVEMQ